MKILKFFSRHKIFTGVLILFFLLVAACVFLSPYYAIKDTFFAGEASGIVSITFDKSDMMRVNKAEIETPKGVTVIDDQALLREIVDCTLVAENSGFSSIFGWYSIRLYKDDLLVRDMDFSLYNRLIRVYDPDQKHIVLFGEGASGYVCISEELLERIQQYLVAHGNGFGEVDGRYEMSISKHKELVMGCEH